MTDEERKDDERFKITDKGQFTADGELRNGLTPERSHRPEPPETGGKEDPNVRSSPLHPDEGPAQGQGGKMDFSSFMLSLATTALVHLGEVPDPSGSPAEADLAAAKQMVEILSMLQEKTAGNRTEDETRLLEDVLYELRMRILSKSQAIKL